MKNRILLISLGLFLMVAFSSCYYGYYQRAPRYAYNPRPVWVQTYPRPYVKVYPRYHRPHYHYHRGYRW